MLKEEICEEEYKESSVVATFFLGEKELKKKEEKNKENTEESLESVPTSPLDSNWRESVENLCISEASIHFRRPAPSWSMRKRVTYRASPEYGLISNFHSVKNAYFITPHSQPISRNAKCSLFVPRPLHRVGLFLRE